METISLGLDARGQTHLDLLGSPASCNADLRYRNWAQGLTSQSPAMWRPCPFGGDETGSGFRVSS